MGILLTSLSTASGVGVGVIAVAATIDAQATPNLWDAAEKGGPWVSVLLFAAVIALVRKLEQREAQLLALHERGVKAMEDANLIGRDTAEITKQTQVAITKLVAVSRLLYRALQRNAAPLTDEEL